MKKLTGLFVAALLGGGASMGLFRILDNENEAAAIQSGLDADRTIVQPVSHSAAITAGEACDFTKAAESSLDAVVHVTTQYNARRTGNYDPFRDFFFGTPNQQRPAMASGSGVILSSDGFVVTNNHVVRGAEKVEVTLNDKRKYEATVVSKDPSSDLALLKIEDSNLPYIAYGNSDDVRVGEWVLAVGNPYNLTSTVTAGIVSAKGRDINILENDPTSGLPAVESFIQTDAAVNPGNSGGALVNVHGELVGINTAIKSQTGSYTGYSFAIPVNIVRKVVDDLLEYGSVQRGFIGVSIRDINPELAEEKGLNGLKGVYVAGMMEDGAAAKSGIKSGDVITQIGTKEVESVTELQEQVSRFRPGDKLIVTVDREGETKNIPVVLTNKYGEAKLLEKENPEMTASLGAHFKAVDKDLKNELGIENGVQVTHLENGKLRKSGLREGFVITKIDKQPVSTYQDVAETLNNKKGGVLIEGVYPNGMKAYYGFGL